MPGFLAVCGLLAALLTCFSGAVFAAEADKPHIAINIPSRTLTLFYGEKAFKTYEVGIGRVDNRTPTGSFRILYKEKNPTWVKPVQPGEEEVVIESGPDNPLGYRWMEFDGLYGIHGTNNPASVGEYVDVYKRQRLAVSAAHEPEELKWAAEIIAEAIGECGV